MNKMYKMLSCALLASASSFPAFAASTISNISFTSNGGAYVNDTIVDNVTSPLAFTATTGLADPFFERE